MVPTQHCSLPPGRTGTQLAAMPTGNTPVIRAPHYLTTRLALRLRHSARAQGGQQHHDPHDSAWVATDKPAELEERLLHATVHGLAGALNTIRTVIAFTLG